jgi:hypothetical protein
MSCSLGIYPGGRKAPGIGPGVGSGCLSVSSQGVGPGLDQEWGKGGVQEGLADSVGVQATGLPAVEPPGGGSKVA